jgi:hypothetical protein
MHLTQLNTFKLQSKTYLVTAIIKQAMAFNNNSFTQQKT